MDNEQPNIAGELSIEELEDYLDDHIEQMEAERSSQGIQADDDTLDDYIDDHIAQVEADRSARDIQAAIEREEREEGRRAKERREPAQNNSVQNDEDYAFELQKEMVAQTLQQEWEDRARQLGLQQAATHGGRQSLKINASQDDEVNQLSPTMQQRIDSAVDKALKKSAEKSWAVKRLETLYKPESEQADLHKYKGIQDALLGVKPWRELQCDGQRPHSLDRIRTHCLLTPLFIENVNYILDSMKLLTERDIIEVQTSFNQYCEGLSLRINFYEEVPKSWRAFVLNTASMEYNQRCRHFAALREHLRDNPQRRHTDSCLALKNRDNEQATLEKSTKSQHSQQTPTPSTPPTPNLDRFRDALRRSDSIATPAPFPPTSPRPHKLTLKLNTPQQVAAAIAESLDVVDKYFEAETNVCRQVETMELLEREESPPRYRSPPGRTWKGKPGVVIPPGYSKFTDIAIPTASAYAKRVPEPSEHSSATPAKRSSPQGPEVNKGIEVWRLNPDAY
jgi:hypothetical protein